jgi:hypothetical protein
VSRVAEKSPSDSALDSESHCRRARDSRLESTRASLVISGAAATGTGVNVPERHPEKCAPRPARLTGRPIVPASDMLTATWDRRGFERSDLNEPGHYFRINILQTSLGELSVTQGPQTRPDIRQASVEFPTSCNRGDGGQVFARLLTGEMLWRRNSM